LMHCIGRPDLANDPELAHNDGRVARVQEIDAAIEAWTMEQSDIDSMLEQLKAARVPSGRIYSVREIADDPHYRARDAITRLQAASGIEVEMPAIFPKLSGNPGAIAHRAPTLGEHTDAVLQEAGFDAATIADLRRRGILAGHRHQAPAREPGTRAPNTPLRKHAAGAYAWNGTALAAPHASGERRPAHGRRDAITFGA